MKTTLFGVELARGIDSINGFSGRQILVKLGKDTGRFRESVRELGVSASSAGERLEGIVGGCLGCAVEARRNRRT
jgi:hypothetical protein